VTKGRGAPEIDIIEAERNKDATYFGGLGQVVSQSAQFAPFTHDYLSANDTTDKFDIYGARARLERADDAHERVQIQT
jgi:hypothetical protein